MLRLIDICKSYKNGKNNFLVLNKINLDFKKNEMVFILGKSGSGKSTLLKIIGGILKSDSGKILLDNLDVTRFNNDMLCNYRNSMIGYIFQDYKLIDYMSLIDNIKLGMTISNNGSNQIDRVLKRINLYDKRKMIVNKLSGGEKQRVAIARAIINNPDIILCDEPTGALDSSNSVNIMNILKEISKEKLVIVVSHDIALANKYADRIINIVDGKVEYLPVVDSRKFRELRKNKIKLLEIIKLAFKHLSLKKGRTFFTSLATSIGLFCMLLVLCLSRSFNYDINNLEKDIVSSFPLTIYNGEFEIAGSDNNNLNDKIYIKNKDDYIHMNKITNKYLDYVKNIDGVNYLSYGYDISMPLISDSYRKLNNTYMKMLPSDNYVYDNYDLIYGTYMFSLNDIVLKIDSNNKVSSLLLGVFNISNDIEYSEIVGRKIRVILNDIYYLKSGDYYYSNNDYKGMYNDSFIELTIVGVVKEKEILDDSSYFYYDGSLIDLVIENNKNSKIVYEQINSDNNILGIDMSKEEVLSFLGYGTLPNMINIYVSNIVNKEKVLSKLDEYNKENDKLIYVDTFKDAIDILKNIVNVLTIVLIIFSMISILVSSMMIFILTNNRTMECVREIGILKCLGARRKDIVRLFNIENLMIGITSSFIGVMFLKLLVKPINMIMELMLMEEGSFNIYFDMVIISVLFNIIIVVLSGYIPTRSASKKEIVDCM